MKIKIQRISWSPEIVFAILALCFGIYFVFATPTFWGIDESTHFLRAYQISEGEIKPVQIGNTFGGIVPVNLQTLRLRSGHDLGFVFPIAQTVTVRDDFKHDPVYQKLTNQPVSKKKSFIDISSAEIYSPLAYLPSVVTIRLIGWMHPSIRLLVDACRIASLLVYIGIIVLALRVLAFTRIKWLVFCIALLPMTLYQASIITADTNLNALCLLSFALIVRGYMKRSPLKKWELAALLIAAASVPAIKSNYLLLVLPLAFLPGINYRRIKIPTWSVRVIIVLATIALGALWLHVSGRVAHELEEAVVSGHPVNARAQLHFIAHKPFSYLNILDNTFMLNQSNYYIQAVGFLGWNYVEMPLTTVIISYLLLFMASIFKDNQSKYNISNKLAWASIGIAALAILGIMTAFYVGYDGVYTPYILGVQGRYFIPILAFVFYGVGKLLPVRLTLSDRQATALFAAGSSLCLVVAAVYYGLATY